MRRSVIDECASSPTHGGNSLQERVVPVLQISRKLAAPDAGLSFAIECETANPAMGVQRLRIKVSPVRGAGQAPLGFASAQPVEIVLRVVEDPEVTAVVKDVAGGGATAHAGGIRAVPGTSDWTEVFNPPKRGQ